MKDRYPDDFNTQSVYDEGYAKYGFSPYDHPPTKGDFAWVRTPEDVMDAVGELQRFADVLKEKRWAVDHDIEVLEKETKRVEKLEADVQAQALQVRAQVEAVTLVMNDNERSREALNNREMILDDRRKKLEKANVDPIQALDEILLQLELEEDPLEILKYMKKRREELEPKW